MRALFFAALAMACGPGGPPLDQTSESEHYVYRYSAGDRVDADAQETYHQWLLSVLPVDPGVKIEYRKYTCRAHMEALTGHVTNGYAESDALRFHTIWPHDNHEVVHTLVSRAWGLAPALFTEGIAVAHQNNPESGVLEPNWNGTDVHVIARSAQATLGIPEIAAIEESAGFRARSEQLMYPLAGSFVRWLIDTRGLAPLEQLFRAAPYGASAAQVEAAFEAAYGISLAGAWSGWRAWLSS